MKRYFYILNVLIIILSGCSAKGQSVTDKLDSLFNQLNKDSLISGSVLIAEFGKPVYERSFGYANLEKKQVNGAQTKFELASVSKQFTAMAIMQLEERGKLKYSDKIQMYFPKLPYADITVKDLLQHTSGLPDFLGWSSDMVNIKKMNTNQDILLALEKHVKKLAFKPKDQFSYSNTNYVLLALIVEKVSGTPFNVYLDQHIFIPLSMKNTKVYAPRGKVKIPDFALGYVYDAVKQTFVVSDSLYANQYVYYFDGVAGPYGISSTVGDLLKWDNALYTEKIIKKVNQDRGYIPARLNDGKPAALSGLPYGFGWLIMPPNKKTGQVYMHSGGYPGYQTIISRYPEKHKTIILLTNKWNVVSIYLLNKAIENILFNEPFVIPTRLPYKKSVQLTAAQIKAVEGTYFIKMAPQVKFQITSELDKVYAQLSGQPKVEIYAENNTEFFYTVVEARLKFTLDNLGMAKSLVLFQNGQEMEAQKEQ
ncbi:serine hydrolase domain-containing protein [Pedobacter metabolipauper]|uniref:CubicO group peptidase (Beta-lactamase class C family) n=1 Tax=Pedobacter metabolipauper TaxID=425513 RepID=A0A4V3D0L3_9SPHI|nr:serine hydrolase domain-containing protein [Pedobacter metabolipauper]TDQ06175.1 CubicO group peptidase (beta-lactamase class C family) [Pedobacter metabolipauper]